jgi:hypothetical protein
MAGCLSYRSTAEACNWLGIFLAETAGPTFLNSAALAKTGTQTIHQLRSAAQSAAPPNPERYLSVGRCITCFQGVM